MLFRLTQDSDSHWFVIPADKEEEWSEYLEMVYAGEEVQEPDWIDAVGGAPSLVKFGSYEIE